MPWEFGGNSQVILVAIIRKKARERINIFKHLFFAGTLSLFRLFQAHYETEPAIYRATCIAIALPIE
ncbi:MAG: hypothetical protein CMB79_08735 [Filomicrobium sp.]|nr:hypothetical protein [Filomicrobium sp.]